MVAYDIFLFASAVIFAAVCFAWIRARAASVFHPVTFYLAFHGLIFVIRPIMSRIFDYQFIYILYGFQPSEWDRIQVILAANLGLLTFTAVAGWAASQPFVFMQDRFDAAHRKAMIKPFLIVCAILTPIAIYSSYQTWISSAYDTSTMISDSATGVKVNTDQSGYFTDIQLTLATMSVVFAWLFRFRLWALAPFFAFFVLRAGTGGRGPFIFASAMMILLFLYDKRRLWPEWRSAALASIALVGFVSVVADRGAAVRSLFIQDATRVYDSGYQFAPLEGMDFANMEYFEYLVHHIPQSTGGYDYFASILQLFTEPVPRIWWEGKPIGAPISFFNIFDYGNPIGITFSLPGYGWFEFGWLGIIILTAAFAGFYAWIYRRMSAHRQGNFAVLVTMVMISMTIITYRDGSVISIAKMTLFYLLPLAMTYALMRLMKIPTAEQMRSAMGRPSTEAIENSDGNGGRLTPAMRRRRLAALANAD